MALPCASDGMCNGQRAIARSLTASSEPMRVNTMLWCQKYSFGTAGMLRQVSLLASFASFQSISSPNIISGQLLHWVHQHQRRALECGCLRPAAISITVLDKRCLRRAACEGVAIVRATESRPREGLLVRTTMRRGSGASSAADGARPVGEWTRRRRQRCLPLSARGLGS